MLAEGAIMAHILLSDFLSFAIGLHRGTTLEDFQNVFQIVLKTYPMNDGTVQGFDKNIVAYFDGAGLYRVELLATDRAYSDGIDMQGLRLDGEEILEWLHGKNIGYAKLILETDETGETYQLTFASKADVVIVSGKVQRIAISY
ncbi:hypothetical protein [Deinococcus sp. QL22]|uniref:hypothetical protein n=1 Tax=Deinococcus sp. QL22 TaxID=2939437 RepID=UPI0020179B5E|nr:hypothetical protein [Deinococcus sp. QL22]UQN06283.1 hypothetical protein M1R55_15710 [Deinococcus sp. QL22]